MRLAVCRVRCVGVWGRECAKSGLVHLIAYGKTTGGLHCMAWHLPPSPLTGGREPPTMTAPVSEGLGHRHGASMHCVR